MQFLRSAWSNSGPRSGPGLTKIAQPGAFGTMNVTLILAPAGTAAGWALPTARPTGCVSSATTRTAGTALLFSTGMMSARVAGWTCGRSGSRNSHAATRRVASARRSAADVDRPRTSPLVARRVARPRLARGPSHPGLPGITSTGRAGGTATYAKNSVIAAVSSENAQRSTILPSRT